MRQKHCALIVAAILVSSRMVRADWNKGPVIIGGDDSDEHYQNAGEYYHREVWNFLGEHVTNEKTLAVCIGCNGLTGFPGMATYAFEHSFGQSDLPPAWDAFIITSATDIENFFTNCSLPGASCQAGAAKIENAGIIYLPASFDNTGGGIEQSQLDVVNAYRTTLESFVAGGNSASRIAAWDGSSWSALGGGIGERGSSESVSVLTVHNGDLIAGGTFISAGDHVSPYLARWGPVGPFVTADFDQSCDVDGDDLAVFRACATGASVPYSPLPAGCTLTPDINGRIAADFDADGDTDLDDFGRFQRCYSGPDQIPDPDCGS